MLTRLFYLLRNIKTVLSNRGYIQSKRIFILEKYAQINTNHGTGTIEIGSHFYAKSNVYQP